MKLSTLADRIVDAEPRLGNTRLVLIDGPSGSGKTTLAYALSGSLPAEVVHTDDMLDGWDDQFTYWERLERQILTPIAAGEPGRFRPYDWDSHGFADEWITVPTSDVLIVEGVGAARAEGRGRASLTIFVDAPLPVREARSLARDGLAMQEQLRAWRKREELHFAADATVWCADVVIGSAA